MLYLWIFGDNVEDRFGHLKFIIFYLLCGLAATFAQLAFSLGSHVPNLGASGAIAGVLGAYILLFPQGSVRVLQGQRVIPVPALVVIGLWFVLQLFSGIGTLANAAQGGNWTLEYQSGQVDASSLFDRQAPSWAGTRDQRRHAGKVGSHLHCATRFEIVWLY